jgi:putative FmdB family regulatory protein
MPTYDYVCDACKHEFEEFQYMSEDALKKCPKCGKKKLRRLIGTGAAILFKGAGFYQTDYRSESYKSAAKSDAPASTSSDSGTKSDSTAATTGTSGGGAKDPGSSAGKKTKSGK